MKKADLKSQIIVSVIFTVICILVIIPFVLVVSISISNEKDIILNGYSLIPRMVDLSAYEFIFNNASAILDAYKVTLLYSSIGTFLSVLLIAMAAYPLSKRDLKGKKFITFYFYFTMLFGGGLVPSYILNTQYLHLDNTLLIYILPSLINVWFMFMMRTFFQGIPYDIIESALIDGASEYRIFFTMILPLSKPVLATIALLTFLGKWNDWMISLLYIDNQKLVSLQYLLQRMLKNIELLRMMADTGGQELVSAKDMPSETVRMAMAIVVAGPALFVFPFFQKYFTKGLTVGSVKG